MPHLYACESPDSSVLNSCLKLIRMRLNDDLITIEENCANIELCQMIYVSSYLQMLRKTSNPYPLMPMGIPDPLLPPCPHPHMLRYKCTLHTLLPSAEMFCPCFHRKNEQVQRNKTAWRGANADLMKNVLQLRTIRPTRLFSFLIHHIRHQNPPKSSTVEVSKSYVQNKKIR